MKFFFVENVRGDQFETELSRAKTTEQAIKEADLLWDRESSYDRKKSAYAYVCAAETDEDGIIDYNTVVELKSYK